MRAASRFLVIILVVLGVLALAAGIIYYIEPAKSLPAFFPGHAAHPSGGHTPPGLAGIIAGAVLLIVAVIIARSGRRSSRYR
jgi:amino acid transporter